MTTPLWFQRMRPASFRGLPFFVDSHDYETGRNVVTHEFPGRDATFAEDTGKRSDVFRVTGFVLGESYYAMRDALITACKEGTPGYLVHPYLGTKHVRCGSIRVSESFSDGGSAKIAFTFYEYGEAAFPFTVLDKAFALLDEVSVAVSVVKNITKEIYRAAGLPSFVIDSAAAIIRNLSSAISITIASARLATDSKALINKSLDTLESSADVLARNGSEMVDLIASIVSQISGASVEDSEQATSRTLFSPPGTQYIQKAMYSLASYSTGWEEMSDATPSRAAEKSNAKAIEQLIRGLAIAELASASSKRTWTSGKEATQTRDALAEYLDEYLLAVESDDLFAEFSKLSNLIVDTIPNADSDLADVATVSLKSDLPSLVVSHDVWGSLDNEPDLIDRNAIRNPCFVSGDVEVVTNGE
jgi:prophage DNA circulation protein